ncbi:MAG TPA: hypothetical protein VHN99_07400 [Deinococcales bacterium]|nr:hypothetical protein [Deinococcales bacterium]
MTTTRPWLGSVTAGLACLALGFGAGRLSGPAAVAPQAPALAASRAVSLPVQLTPPAQAPNDPRELIPLSPQNGQQNGGSGQQPGQGQGTTCPLYVLQDGQLYKLPGGQPVPGQQGGGGGSPELIPLQPGGGGTPDPGVTPGGPSVPQQPSTPNPALPTIPSTRS